MTYNPSLKDQSFGVGYVAQLLSEVFGINSPVYLPVWPDKSVPASPYPDVQIEDEQPEYYDAPVRFGNKTFGAFWLKGGKYNSFDYDGKLIKRSYSDFLMPLATLIDFSREKVMAETPMHGGNGEVNEIFGFSSWKISINGIIIPDKENRPAFRTVEGQKSAIQRFHEIADSIEVDGQIFAERDISRIVTKSLTFSAIQGKPHMIQYSIEAKSDDDELAAL